MNLYKWYYHVLQQIWNILYHYQVLQSLMNVLLTKQALLPHTEMKLCQRSTRKNEFSAKSRCNICYDHLKKGPKKICTPYCLESRSWKFLTCLSFKSSKIKNWAQNVTFVHLFSIIKDFKKCLYPYHMGLWKSLI